MAEAESDTANKHVVALLREELHKLEYSYDRDMRLNPPEKSVGKVSLTKSVQDRLKYLTEQKESMELDIKNLTRDRNAIQDVKTQDLIGKYLDDYDYYNELISRKLFKVNELRRNNSAMIKMIEELSKELNRRNALIREESDKFVTQKGNLESKLHAAQASLNRLTYNNNELLKEIESSLTQRKSLHSIFLKQTKEYSELKGVVGKEAKLGCNLFRAYNAAKAKVDSFVAKYNSQYNQYLVTISELYRTVDEKKDTRLYFETIQSRREDTEYSDRNTRHHIKFQEKLKEIAEQYKFLEDNHNQLLEVCQPCETLEEIAYAYNLIEEENLACVMKIIELDTKLNEISRENHELVKKLDEFYETFPGVKTISREQELTQLKLLFEETDDQLIQRETMDDLAEHCLSILTPALKDAYEALGGEPDALSAFLGAKKGFTGNNIDLCISLMEHKVGQLLFEKKYYETWKTMKDGEANPKVPELIFGSPLAAGGIISPDIRLPANSNEIAEELDEILNQLDKTEPVLPIDIIPEAREKVWKQTVRKKETAARIAELTRKETEKVMASETSSVEELESKKSSNIIDSKKPSKVPSSKPSRVQFAHPVPSEKIEPTASVSRLSSKK